VTITVVPLLVREQERVFPFLHQAFAHGGVLEGHEVYAFVPSTITAVEGDTLHLTVINPEDDAHTLVLPGLALTLPGQTTTRATYVAKAAGIYAFTCDLPAHAPMMWGQLVVLAPEAVRRGGAGP
jgi:plastocyanin